VSPWTWHFSVNYLHQASRNFFIITGDLNTRSRFSVETLKNVVGIYEKVKQHFRAELQWGVAIATNLVISNQNRHQKIFNRGVLRLCGRAWHSKNWQTLYWFTVFNVSIWGGLELRLGGISPPTPVATGLYQSYTFY